MKNLPKKIFISYGNELYYNSLERLRKQATDTGLFDEIIIYTDKDLDDDIKANPLMSYKRGGGYWVWKPYVILKTLQQCGNEDIVIYSDSGNEIYEDEEWHKYFRDLQNHDAVFFQYGAIMEKWCRKNILQYFSDIKNLSKRYQLMGSLSLWKKQATDVCQEWLQTMMSHPEFVIDVNDSERKYENPDFKEHRHDQAVLTCVVKRLIKSHRLKIRWQHSEYRDSKGQAVFNARISDNMRRSSDEYEPRYRIYLRKVNNILRNIKEYALCKI